MIYGQRFAQVEAQRVSLADGEYVVGKFGQAEPEIVPAKYFDMFFAGGGVKPKPDKPVELPFKFKKAAKPLKPKPAKPAKAEKAAKTESGGLYEVVDAIRRAVAEEPRGVHATIDRVCDFLRWDEKDKAIRTKIQQSIFYQVSTGKLDRRTDPNTQLSNLYLPKGGA